MFPNDWPLIGWIAVLVLAFNGGMRTLDGYQRITGRRLNALLRGGLTLVLLIPWVLLVIAGWYAVGLLVVSTLVFGVVVIPAILVLILCITVVRRWRPRV